LEFDGTTLLVEAGAKAYRAEIVTVNSGTLSTTTHAGEVIFSTAVGGTINLDASPDAGETYTFVYNATTTGTITIGGNGNNIVKDTTSATTYAWTVTGSGDSLTCIYNGSAWVAIGK
jgi:hypothetical protein